MEATALTVTEYFMWGALSGAVGYAYYLYVTRYASPSNNHVYTTGLRGFMLALLGVVLSSLLGGLFAVAFDRSRATSIITGVFTFFIYTSILRGLKSGSFLNAMRELLIKLLTGGVK